MFSRTNKIRLISALSLVGILYSLSAISEDKAKPTKDKVDPVYEAKYKIFHLGKFFGNYEEKLLKVNEGFRFEYVLEMGAKESKRTEAFIGFMKDDKMLTPIRYSLTFDTPSATDVGESWIQGKFENGKLIVLTRSGTSGKEVSREITKGTFMSSMLPLYLSRFDKKGKTVEFNAFDEEGKIDKFHSVQGIAKYSGKENLEGREADKFEVSWGLLNTIFWVLPDGSLLKMENPTSKLELKRIWES